jgi:hypothetical protein
MMRVKIGSPSGRQVVVLTHDVALLYELETYAERMGVACNSQALRKVGGRPGITDPDLPWATPASRAGAAS